WRIGIEFRGKGMVRLYTGGKRQQDKAKQGDKGSHRTVLLILLLLGRAIGVADVFEMVQVVVVFQTGNFQQFVFGTIEGQFDGPGPGVWNRIADRGPVLD